MGSRLKVRKQVPTVGSIGKSRENIVFGFSELSPFSYVDADKDGTFFIDFLARLKKLCCIDWNTINVSARHSFGTEKIYVRDMTAKAQSHVPDGMDSLTVFRATGDNHAFLGYRDCNVFQVILIEHRFGDVYKH